MEKTSLSPYRWVIQILFLLTLLAQSSAWLAPAPILAPMIKSLDITLAQGGLIIGVIALCIVIFGMTGAEVIQRLGARRAMLASSWAIAIGEILSGYCTEFWPLIACRVLIGVGYGIGIAPLGAFQMQWFGKNEWAYITLANSVAASLGVTLVFWVTVPIFESLDGSWMHVFRYYGFACAGVSILWTIFGRERVASTAQTSTAAVVAAAGAPTPTAAGAPSRGSIIAEMLRKRDVMLVATAMFCGLFVSQLYTTFLAQYFHASRGLSLTEASTLTAVLPTSGTVAAVLAGLGTAYTRRRKPFLWPVEIGALLGCIVAVTIDAPIIVRVALVLVGIAATATGTAIITLVMELPGMTPRRAGAAIALVWSFGYAGAFLAPVLGGAIAQSVGLEKVLLAATALQVIQITAMFLLPETGTGRMRERTTVAA